jgi:ClpP class serine protease
MSAHLRIAQRAFNTPLLFDPSKAQAFLAGLGARVLGGRLVLPASEAPEERIARAARTGPRVSVIDGGSGRRRLARGDRLYPVIDGVALIEVTGSLVHRGSWLEGSGVTSYERLREAIDAARTDASVLGIALEIDSFGGEAAGCFDLADQIRAARAEKPIQAFVAESALSGGYAIASQADRIILPRTGEVGSIGVLTMHVDYGAALEMDGIAVTLIQSGARKTDGHPYGPLPDEVRADWQARVDTLRAIFAETVAAGRGERLTARAALATEAACLGGAEAVAAGLADEVADPRAAFAAFVAEVNGRATITSNGAPAGAKEKETTMSSQTSSDAEPAPDIEPPAPTPTAEEQREDTPPPPLAASEAASGAATIPVAQATALAEVAAQASALGVTIDLAGAIRNGTSADALRASVMSRLAARSEEAAVSTAHPVRVAAESPIVAAARKSAAARR